MPANARPTSENTMISIAARMSRFEESASARASQIARALKAQGRDILALTTGEPDFPTPEHVKQAAIEAMKREQTKYTNVDGMPDLKRAIQAKFRRENGLDYAPDQIIVCAGAKQAIFNALTATLEPGEEVIVPAPYYVSYFDMTRLAGGEPRRPRRAPHSSTRGAVRRHHRSRPSARGQRDERTSTSRRREVRGLDVPRPAPDATRLWDSPILRSMLAAYSARSGEVYDDAPGPACCIADGSFRRGPLTIADGRLCAWRSSERVGTRAIVGIAHRRSTAGAETDGDGR